MTEAPRGSELSHECIFCQIVEGSMPATFIDEGNHTVTFVSLEGYPLIVPRKHIKDIFDPEINQEIVGEVAQKIVEISRATQKALQVPGINIVSANGREAGQEIMHLHFHIIPRTQNDQKIIFHRLGNVDVDNRLEIANLIKTNLIK